MDCRQILLLAATFILSLSTADAQTRSLQGSKRGDIRNESFENRMKMYSDWARFTQAQGRRLSQAWAPEAAPPPPVPVTPPVVPLTPSYGAPVTPAVVTTAPPYGVPVTPTVVQPTPYGATVPIPPAVPTPIPPASPVPSPGFGGCKVLKWYTGYANTTLYYNRIVPNTPNFGECCKQCQADDKCVAWTRVAGGDPPNFRNCYLKYDIKALDQSPAKDTGNHEGHPGDTQTYPELRYVDQNYPSAAAPIILESGTTPDIYPPDYYGCPYAPGNPTTPCVAPPTCNVDGNGVFVAPPCIQ